MSSRWLTFERLICELGAIRAFTDEVEQSPELAEDAAVSQLRAALAVATGAISRTVGDFNEQLDDADDRLVIDAWTALAHAQEAVGRARSLIQGGRLSHKGAAGGQARHQREPIPRWIESLGDPVRRRAAEDPAES